MAIFTPLNKKIIIAVALLVAVTASFFAVVRYSAFTALDDFLNQSYSVRILDARDRIVQITPLDNGKRKEFTPLSDIPSSVKDAFITAEDKRFYSHHGVDYIAILRALKQNVAKMDRTSGASTITMQLARIISPSQHRNIAAKLKDTFNAYRLESRLTKDEILELYLNNIPLGFNVDGVTSGCRLFFSEDLNEITPEQAEMLAMVPRNPSLYSPAVNSNTKHYEWPFYMPHLVERIKSEAGSSFGRELKEIHLTVDLDVQEFAQEQLNYALRKGAVSRISNGAVVVIENKTGNILTWVGSNDWFDNIHSGQLDGVLNPVQMGSTMKPFMYALALDNGVPVNTVLPDVPTRFGYSNIYVPENFNNKFNGPVLLRTALASSLNIPALFELDQLGVEKYYNCLLNLGFDSLKNVDHKDNLGLVLGAGETSLLELVNAFSVFTRDGIYLPVRYFVEQKASEGEKRIFSTDSVRIIDSILSDKSARYLGFGLRQTFETKYPSIFKTGTANQYQNIVAVGATPEYTVGVWMGNFSGNTVVGKTGSSLPASVAKKVLDRLVGDRRIDFPKPENYEKVEICSVSGKSPSQSCPHRAYEYVEKTSIPAFREDRCDWHKKENGKIVTLYPAEYQDWVRPDMMDCRIDYTSSPLKILSPMSNSQFFNHGVKSENQMIQAEVIGGKDKNGVLTVFLDNDRPFTVSRPFIFSIPVTAGVHQLKVMLEDEEDSILYTVK